MPLASQASNLPFPVSLGQTAGACGTTEEALGGCAEDEGQGGEAGDRVEGE